MIADGHGSPEDAEDDAWNGAIRPALEVVGPGAVASKLSVSERTAQAWAFGANRPGNQTDVARAIDRIACDFGIDDTDAKDAIEQCRVLPERLALACLFNAMMTTILTVRFNDRTGLARKLGVGRGAVDAAIAPPKLGKLGPARAFLQKIGRLSRVAVREHCDKIAEATGKKPRYSGIPDGPAGDRVACIAFLSLICDPKRTRPKILSPEQCLKFAEMIVAKAANPTRPNWFALMGEMAKALKANPE